MHIGYGIPKTRRQQAIAHRSHPSHTITHTESWNPVCIIVFEESEAYGAYPILLVLLLVSSFKVQVQVKILFGSFTYSGL